MGQKIIVYGKPNCGACDITRKWLTENNLNHEYVDAYEDEKAMELIQEKGFRGFPVVNVNNWEKSWSDFNYLELNRLILE